MRRNQLGVAIAATVVASGVLLAAVGSGRLPFSSPLSLLRASAVPTSSRASTATASNTSKPPPKPAPLVKLEIEAPKYKKDLPLGLMFSSGWPITIRAVINQSALGITTDAMPSEFPTIYDGENGYVVFDDPDGCLELPPPYFRGPPGYACSEDPSDETYMGFTPDIDEVGRVDSSGNPDRLTALADPAISGQPAFTNLRETYPSGSPVLVTESLLVGTKTGDSVSDGVGYGADDDMPGLVLLSPTGTGLVLGATFDPPYVRQQRNLAGFLNSVSYELRDPTGSTVITGHLVVPQSLIAPLMEIDDCVGDPSESPCRGDALYRIDGAPVQSSPNTTGATYPYNVQVLYPRIFNTRTYELRAFVVSGVAPSVLADMNGDGRIDAADASSAGYQVISNEEVIRVRQYHGDICGGVSYLNVVQADFDGNGRVLSYLVCPAGPGVLKPIPQ